VKLTSVDVGLGHKVVDGVGSDGAAVLDADGVGGVHVVHVGDLVADELVRGLGLVRGAHETGTFV